MAFVEAYSTRTGKKLPYLVPEHHIDHPLLGVHLSRLPSRKRAAGQDESTDTGLELVDGLGTDEPGDDTTTVPVNGLDQDTSTEVPDLTTTTITETPAAGDEEE